MVQEQIRGYRSVDVWTVRGSGRLIVDDDAEERWARGCCIVDTELIASQ